MYSKLTFYNAVAWEEITGNVICFPTDPRNCPDQYLQKNSSYCWQKPTGWGRKKENTYKEKRRSHKIFTWKKCQLGKLKHAETCNSTTDSTAATGNLKQCLAFVKDLPFNLIRAGAQRSVVPCSFWKVTGKTPRNQEVFMISIDFQFSWFIFSLSQRLMLVSSKLYVEFPLIRCLCNRH